jgi:hypothetical protein
LAKRSERTVREPAETAVRSAAARCAACAIRANVVFGRHAQLGREIKPKVDAVPVRRAGQNSSIAGVEKLGDGEGRTVPDAQLRGATFRSRGIGSAWCRG